MARPRVFVSSTYNDLKHIRSWLTYRLATNEGRTRTTATWSFLNGLD